MTRTRHALVIALAVVPVLALASAASAGEHARDATEHKSTITIDDQSTSQYPIDTVFGYITSSDKCLANRTVKLLFQDGVAGPYHQVDTDRSSANGAWAGEGTTDADTENVKAVLAKSTYGPKHHRQVCGAATSNTINVDD